MLPVTTVSKHLLDFPTAFDELSDRLVALLRATKLGCICLARVSFRGYDDQPMERLNARRRALSTRCDAPEKASRPWDKGRDGFVMGEGAGVLVFESLDHAQKRGAPIIAEYLGGAFTCDAHHMTDPRPDGLGVSTCIELALQNAGVEREQVSYSQPITLLPTEDTSFRFSLQAKNVSKLS